MRSIEVKYFQPCQDISLVDPVKADAKVSFSSIHNTVPPVSLELATLRSLV